MYISANLLIFLLQFDEKQFQMYLQPKYSIVQNHIVSRGVGPLAASGSRYDLSE